jgi:hypothetical protein
MSRRTRPPLGQGDGGVHLLQADPLEVDQVGPFRRVDRPLAQNRPASVVPVQAARSGLTFSIARYTMMSWSHRSASASMPPCSTWLTRGPVGGFPGKVQADP